MYRTLGPFVCLGLALSAIQLFLFVGLYYIVLLCQPLVQGLHLSVKWSDEGYRWLRLRAK